MTADDVVFSYDRVMDPKNNSLYSQFTDFVIDSITKKDESTVVIKLKFPFEELLANRLATFKVVPKVIVEKDQKKFDANPVGTGPWKMTANGSGAPSNSPGTSTTTGLVRPRRRRWFGTSCRTRMPVPTP